MTKEDGPEVKNLRKGVMNTAVEITEFTSKRSRVATGNEVNNPRAVTRLSKNSSKSPSSKGNTPKLKNSKNVHRPIAAEKNKNTKEKTPGKQVCDGQTDLTMESTDQIPQIPPDNDKFGYQYDGILVGVNESEDNFGDSDLENNDKEERSIEPTKSTQQGTKLDEIPPEVVEQLKAHPVMQNYIAGVVEQKIQESLKSVRQEGNTLIMPTEILRQNLGSHDNPRELNANSNASHRRGSEHVDRVLAAKSPSDTTIYRPALLKGVNESNEVINKISNFVENIRINSKSATPTSARGKHDTSTDKRRERRTPTPSRGYSHGKRRDYDDVRPGTSGKNSKEVREAAQLITLDADQYKAELPQSKGKFFESFDFEKFLHNMDDDDEFFHVTCHIDNNLRGKIGRGEFVDLEKLLPKGKTFSGGHVGSNHDESKIELVSRNGQTYFKLVNESQINGIRKWEQAFRIYAAIYTEANPHRSVEIWQYMHVINIAATSFQWENVASYDLTFRQLMAFKPHRSWSKTYLQGWNLAMRDPIGKSQNNGSSKGGNSPQDWRERCCWKYNRNRCHKDFCHFDHRCTYCGGWNHGFHNCRKRLRKSGGSQESRSGSGNANHNNNNGHAHKHQKKRNGGSPHSK